MIPEQLTPEEVTLPGVPDTTVQAIVQALNGLRYGQVTIIVQDGRIMQIDRTDRYRLPTTPPDVRRIDE